MTETPRRPMQIDTDTRADYDRYDALRAVRTCPLCNGKKAAGLLVCWPCYRAHNLRNGMRPATQQIIEQAADDANAVHYSVHYTPCQNTIPSLDDGAPQHCAAASADAAVLHYTDTANHRAACHQYRRPVPAAEPGTADRAAVTCADCRELMEQPATNDR